jgi:hypothetical protein
MTASVEYQGGASISSIPRTDRLMNTEIPQLGRAKLAQLGREYMLAAQFNSRTGYAALQMNQGPEAYLDTAIANWMAVSPIYTQRMQKAMRLNTGTDIATILKGMQLECGLSHQYFDAGFRELSATEGEFWLNRCGPLLETEPRGEAAVKTMCHDIEDPTFDATAVATNPRARVRPIHRPPRQAPDQTPHCHWRVVIEAEASALTEPDITAVMRQTELAQLSIARPEGGAAGGLDYYDGPVFETLQLERFSHSALVVICKELATQIQLLVNSLSLVVGQRYGQQAVTDIARFQMAGTGWVVSERLAAAFGHDRGGIDAIVEVLRIHPTFQPDEYFGLVVEKRDDVSARLSFAPSIADREPQALGWYPLLRAGETEGLEAIVKGVDPRATIAPVAGQDMSWDVVLKAAAEPEEVPLAVQIARVTVLYKTALENHLQLIELS